MPFLPATSSPSPGNGFQQRRFLSFRYFHVLTAVQLLAIDFLPRRASRRSLGPCSSLVARSYWRCYFSVALLSSSLTWLPKRRVTSLGAGLMFDGKRLVFCQRCWTHLVGVMSTDNQQTLTALPYWFLPSLGDNKYFYNRKNSTYFQNADYGTVCCVYLVKYCYTERCFFTRGKERLYRCFSKAMFLFPYTKLSRHRNKRFLKRWKFTFS
jgi:hypothetical protein